MKTLLTYSEEQIQAIGAYLAKKPFVEVEKLINLLRSPVKTEQQQEAANVQEAKKED